MSRQSKHFHCIKSIAILSIFALAVVGCSSGGDLATEFSGKWKNEKTADTVDINLAKDSASLTIDGRTYQGAVEKIDPGTNTVHIKMNTDGGQAEEWSIHQVWNDNGSSFKLTLRRNGSTETLVPVGHS